MNLCPFWFKGAFKGTWTPSKDGIGAYSESLKTSGQVNNDAGKLCAAVGQRADLSFRAQEFGLGEIWCVRMP